MAVIKCKGCGAPLPLEEGKKIVQCVWCDMRQTVPVADNGKKIKLFNRAHELQLECEFDKAEGIYESIVAEFPTEAEAYWGLLLCHYGIEYVDDPRTGKKIPTCHRTSYSSVLEDKNYKLACQYADEDMAELYVSDAQELENLRSGIVSTSSKADPYDIFISYKETDENGNRTQDSLIAETLYEELSAKGYKIFFSRITLEGKLGIDFEHYIFAALNSAPIMLVVGTSAEHINSVWVKNEWKRYIRLMAEDKKRTLIPCFKEMQIGALPIELQKLQCQDMGKLGAVQDLLRGIDKILGRCEQSGLQGQMMVQHGNMGVEPLLRRIRMFMEDRDWKLADEYCEKVLDMEPENSEAYVYKFLVIQKSQSLQNVLNERYAQFTNGQKTIGERQLLEERNWLQRDKNLIRAQKYEKDGRVAGMLKTYYTKIEEYSTEYGQQSSGESNGGKKLYLEEMRNHDRIEIGEHGGTLGRYGDFGAVYFQSRGMNTISGEHCILRVEEDRWMLYHVSRTNQTKYNGRILMSNEGVRLVNGAIITLANTVSFIVRLV